MKLSETEQKLLEIQEFRYSVIAELSNPYLEHGEINALIREKAKREYRIPYSDRKRLSRGCIKKWYLKFKKYGKEGLVTKRRVDLGKCRALPEKEQAVLLEALEKQPDLTTTAVAKDLLKQGKITSPISKSTLSRLAIASGMDKKARDRQVSDEKNLKFEFFGPLECVQADCMHGFAVPTDNGKMVKAILLAFLDDATRRILYANFTGSECSLEFEKGIKHILKAHGLIGVLYVDNGSTFVSNQTKRILDILKIRLVHSTVRRPQGRGKLERFFRTLRDQFLRPLNQESIKSMADLNMRLHTWLETEYHRNPHHGLNNKTPLDVWLEKCKYIITLDPTVNLDEVFLHETRRKVYKDNTFTLYGTLYEVPVTLAGNTVRLLYDPFLPVLRPQVWLEGVFQGEARIVDSYANTKVVRNKTTHGGCLPSADGSETVETTGNHQVSAALAASIIRTNKPEV